jgi:hypothetical protein
MTPEHETLFALIKSYGANQGLSGFWNGKVDTDGQVAQDRSTHYRIEAENVLVQIQTLLMNK